MTGWSGRPINQSRVAAAIGVTSPSVSSYENGTVPPVLRLRDYAIFFASPRWLDPDAPRRVDLDFLNPSERRTFAELNTELTDLRRAAEATATTVPAAPPTAFWRFPDGEPVRILCGRLSEQSAGRYADPAEANYMRLRTAADLDSLVELWGHIRRLNPDSDVRFRIGDNYTDDDLSSHVVVLGNIAQSQGAGRLLPKDTLPVRQSDVDDDDLEGEIFEVDLEDGSTERFEPVLVGGRVVEDVGLLARVPNPHFTAGTFTVCSGVFTRGVYGAVRSLTDRTKRDNNAAYLRETFTDTSAFAMLMRVRMAGDATVPAPDLREKGNRLLELDLAAS